MTYNNRSHCTFKLISLPSDYCWLHYEPSARCLQTSRHLPSPFSGNAQFHLKKCKKNFITNLKVISRESAKQKIFTFCAVFLFKSISTRMQFTSFFLTNASLEYKKKKIGRKITNFNDDDPGEWRWKQAKHNFNVSVCIYTKKKAVECSSIYTIHTYLHIIFSEPLFFGGCLQRVTYRWILIGIINYAWLCAWRHFALNFFFLQYFSKNDFFSSLSSFFFHTTAQHNFFYYFTL